MKHQMTVDFNNLRRQLKRNETIYLEFKVYAICSKIQKAEQRI